MLGEVAIPYQGAYCAGKFAVKGFTEALRREAEAERQPNSFTLIKPAAINTPFTDHARNRLGSPGTRNPPPAYDPHLVARAIAYACETPVRDLTIGGTGGVSTVLGNAEVSVAGMACAPGYLPNAQTLPLRFKRPLCYTICLDAPNVGRHATADIV